MLALARALHRSGVAAQRLETSLMTVALRLGLEQPQFFSTPTQLMATFGPEGRQDVHVLRVEPAGVNLGRLSRLDEVVRAVGEGQLGAAQGVRRVRAIMEAPPPYGPLLTLLAYAAGSGGVARLLGGGQAEMLAGAGCGVVTGLVGLWIERHPRFDRLFEPLGAFAVAFVATAAAGLVAPFAVYTATLAGIVVLLPGFLLTTALRELSTRHLAAGTARLAAAVMVFLGLGFGVALGDRLAELLVGTVRSAQPAVLPAWTAAGAVIATSLSFVIKLRADARDALWVTLAGVIAYGAGRVGSRALGFELGMFVAALAVGAFAGLFAWWRDRPQAIVLVPGTLILVPGTLGFRSLANLLEHDVLSGINTAFTMLMAFTALAAGLIFAGVMVPARRVRSAL